VITPGNPNPYITPLAVIVTLLLLLAPLISTGRFGRSRMADLTLILSSLLFTSGAILQFGPEVGGLRRTFLVAHLVGGILVLLPVHLYLLGHLGDALRRKPVGLVRSGIGSMALVLGCVWTGTLITFLQAKEMEILSVPHAVLGWSLVLFCAFHIRVGRAALAQSETPPPARRRFVLEGILPGVALVALAFAIHLGSPKTESWEASSGELPPGHADLTQATTTNGSPLSGERWNWEPVTCSSPGGYCHIDNVTQWKRSTHALSANPAYLAVLNQFETTRPGKSTYCAGCHEPRAALSDGNFGPNHSDRKDHAPTLSLGVDGTFVSDGATGKPTTIPPVGPGHLGEGVGCQVCHRSKPRDTKDQHTGGYTMSPVPADLVRTSFVPFLNFPMILADLDKHRERLLGEDSLHGIDGCTVCHVHRIPDAVHPGIQGLVVADHKTPFETSSVAQEGGECVDCHMPPIYGPLDPTWTRSHAFPSGNTGVPWLLNLPERVSEAQEFLSTDKIALDVECHRITETETETEELECTATIRNEGVGHHFPAGPRDLVEVWLEVTARSDERVLATLGALDSSGRIQKSPLNFRQTLYDENDQQLHLHEFWLATRQEGLPPIGPGEQSGAKVQFPVTASEVTITAKIKHRRYNPDFIRAAFGPEHELAPITTLAKAEIVVP
jgi:hypothetical protein